MSFEKHVSPSLVRISICVIVLTALSGLASLIIREPLYIFDAGHIGILFAGSNTAFLARYEAI
eukprot:5504189-Pleurochrysis_carterae.AAC.1